MKARNSSRRYVVCVNNAGYPVSLEVRKIYRALPDVAASRRGLVRIIDESGEDYLYPEGYFVTLALPKAAERLLGTKPGSRQAAGA
jgi:hypothetical protein